MSAESDEQHIILSTYLEVHLRARANRGQHGARHANGFDKLIVPLQSIDVHEQRPGRVSDIRDMVLTA
jgi:hypothetical protein